MEKIRADDRISEYLKASEEIVKLIIRMCKAKGRGRAYKEFVKLYIMREKENTQVNRTKIIRGLMDEGYHREEAGKIYELYHKRGTERFKDDAEMLANMLLIDIIPKTLVVRTLATKEIDGTYNLQDIRDRIKKVLKGA